jgi:CheY-like chemotaxis protein
LSTAQSAIRQMGGDLRIDSSLGKGTSVHLFLRVTMLRPALPVDFAAPAAAPPPALAAMPVLYVEDNALVSLSTIDVLEQAGLTVHAVPDGFEALQLLEAQPEINVMITDVGLPGMDGHELARQARRHRPHLAILFLSGYDRSRLAGGMLDDPNTLYLGKPYDDADLLNALRKLQSGAVGAA